MNTIIKELFRPSLPPIWVPAVDVPPEKRCNTAISGIASLLGQCMPDPNFVATKSAAQITQAQNQEKTQLKAQEFSRAKSLYNPVKDPNAIGITSAQSILFVARLNYSLSEEELKGHFEQYGPVKEVRIVRDSNKVSRGYGFVVFESQQVVSQALREANNALVKGSRILVDHYRALNRNWLPMRLGGGLGGRKARNTMREPEKTYSAYSPRPRRGGSHAGSRGRTPYDRPNRPHRGRDGPDNGYRSGYQSRNSQPRDNGHTSDNRHSRYVQDFDGPRNRYPSQDRESRSRDNPRDPARNHPRESQAPQNHRPGGRTLRKY